MINAKAELLEELEDKPEIVIAVVKHDYRLMVYDADDGPSAYDRFLHELDFEYNEDYGTQHLFGTVLFSDGSWLERKEYDGREWWYHARPQTKESIMYWYGL